MRYILVTTLALLSLSSTTLIAQPDTQLRVSQNDNRKWQDDNQQKQHDNEAAAKQADQKRAAEQRKAAEQAAKDKRTKDRSPARQKINGQRANEQKVRDQKAIEQRSNQQKRIEQSRQEKNRNDARDAQDRRDRDNAAQRAKEQNARDQRAIEQRANEQNRIEQSRQEKNRNDARDAQDRRNRDNAAQRANERRWSRGDRLPDQYRQDRYHVNNWQQHGLSQPPRGYRWVRDDNNDFYLAAISTGIVSTVIYRSDREKRWRQHYSRTYSYQDDIYYRECRNGPDPAGIIAGAIIGGLLGHTTSGGRTEATLAGIILGGTVGAALTNNLDCEDRSYAYKTYYEGFNSGRAGSQYVWRNPRNDHRGEFRVRDYYNDPYGFRCANFTQVTYIQGRSYSTNGRACRQPDGTWATIN